MGKSNYKLVIKRNEEGKIIEERTITISEAMELFIKQQIKLSDLRIKEND